MKPTKSYLSQHRHEARDDRTYRVSKELIEDELTERQEKTHRLREARLRHNATTVKEAGKGASDNN